MDEHDDLGKYIEDGDFPDSCFFSTTDKSGTIRMGFACPYGCDYAYDPKSSSGSTSVALEKGAAMMKFRAHALSCRGFRAILVERKGVATGDPIILRYLEIKRRFERGEENQLPAAWKAEIAEFRRTHIRGGKPL